MIPDMLENKEFNKLNEFNKIKKQINWYIDCGGRDFL